jgi:hypothetical protein
VKKRDPIVYAIIIPFIISISFVGAFIYTINSPLRWSVDEGDLLQYHVLHNSTSYSYATSPENSDYNILEFYATIEIVSLPVLQQFYTATEFGNHVVNYQKSVSSFLNGSSQSWLINSTVNGLVSTSILPIGNWFSVRTLINEYTPPHAGFDSLTFAIEIDSTYIRLNYALIGPDHRLDWSATVDPKNGTPIYISYNSRFLNTLTSVLSSVDMYISLVDL